MPKLNPKYENLASKPRVNPERVIQTFIDALKLGFKNLGKHSCTIQLTFSYVENHDIFISFQSDTFIVNDYKSVHIAAKIKFAIVSLDKYFNEIDLTPEYRSDLSEDDLIYYYGNNSIVTELIVSLLKPFPKTISRFRRSERKYKSRSGSLVSEVKIFSAPSELELLSVMEDGDPAKILGVSDKFVRSLSTFDQLSMSKNVLDFAGVDVSKIYNECKNTHRKMRWHNGIGKLRGLRQPFTFPTASFLSEYDKIYTPYFSNNDFFPAQLWTGLNVNNCNYDIHRNAFVEFFVVVAGKVEIDLYPPVTKFSSEIMIDLDFRQSHSLPEVTGCSSLSGGHHSLKKLSIVVSSGEIFVQPEGWFKRVTSFIPQTKVISLFWKY